MPRNQNHKALGKAIRKRRIELDITQQDAVERTHEADVEVYDADGRGAVHPGVSRTTWIGMERGEPAKRRDPTLRLVDAALEWPEGTARAILSGEDMPEGSPVDLPSRDAGDNGRPYATESELARALRDVADLRVRVVDQESEVSHLRQDIDGLRETVDTLAKLIEGLTGAAKRK